MHLAAQHCHLCFALHMCCILLLPCLYPGSQLSGNLAVKQGPILERVLFPSPFLLLLPGQSPSLLLSKAPRGHGSLFLGTPASNPHKLAPPPQRNNLAPLLHVRRPLCSLVRPGDLLATGLRFGASLGEECLSPLRNCRILLQRADLVALRNLGSRSLLDGVPRPWCWKTKRGTASPVGAKASTFFKASARACQCHCAAFCQAS